jgi:glycosyltransferase involved in cell wall biosynthesis
VKLLCVTHYFPLPADRGGAIRVLGLLRGLAEDHDVTLLATADPLPGEDRIEELARLGIDGTAFARPEDPAARGAGVWMSAQRRGAPPWVLAEWSSELDARARELAPHHDALVVLDDYAGAYAAGVRAAAPGIRVIADKHVVLGAWANGAGPAGLRDRARDALARRLTRRYESAYLEHADSVVVTAPEEAARYERLYGSRPEVVVSAVDLARVARPAAGSRTIGWLGSLDGPPVVDGLRRFVDEAWEPLARDGYELHVVGRNPPREISDLAHRPGVRLIGYVEDLEAFFDSIAAAVIPLWDGQGIKLKTLTLLGAGVPTAATPTALEGIAAEHGRHCLKAADPADLAAAARRLCEDADMADELGWNARALVAEGHSWDAVAPRFARIVERAGEAAA